VEEVIIEPEINERPPLSLFESIFNNDDEDYYDV
jgi:hypothetical protein